MLSASSRAQRNLREEDGSGSDAGSEVSLEPETDRFGFILTNGSTAGAGPPPEVVRQRENKWLSIMLQWDRLLLKKTSKVKEQCQKGIPASLRAKCWPLLCAATNRMKLNENLYKFLDLQPALRSWVDVIERDLDRQFPFHEMFVCKDGHGQRGLFRVLKAYTQYRPDEGYCQAQGPVAAVLLMNMPAEEAFWCLVQISEQYLPGYYSPLLEGVLFDAGMLTWVLKQTCPAAHKHLQRHGVEPLMFATDWLMCLFTRHLPFNTLLRVWDLFFCYGVRVLLQVAVVLVRRVLGNAKQRKQCQGQMETLERLRGVREQVQEEDDAFIAEVCSVPLSAKDLETQTEKELDKWKKDKPLSTFDPRGRCLGYRVAWARAWQSKEEQDRKEREKGNLSIPLVRSASILSLSAGPSKLRKRSKVSGGKISRHFSLGAKDDCRSWTEPNFKRVQEIQEEEDEEEKKKQEEVKLTAHTEVTALLEPEEKESLQNNPTEQTEEKEITLQEKDRAETREAETHESEPTKTEEDKTLIGQEEETQPSPADAQAHTSDHNQGETGLSHKGRAEEIDVKDTNVKTEDISGSDHSASVEQGISDLCTREETDVHVDSSEEQMIQSNMKPDEGVQSQSELLLLQVETVTETSEARTEMEKTENVNESTQTTETDKHKDQIVEAGVVVSEVTYCCTESEVKEKVDTLPEMGCEDMVDESIVTQNECGNEMGETDEGRTDSKTETATSNLSLPEHTEHQEINIIGNTEAELQKQDQVDCGTTQEKEEIILECLQDDSEPTQREETPTETPMDEKNEDSAATIPMEETLNRTVQLDSEHDGKIRSGEITEEPVSEQLTDPSEGRKVEEEEKEEKCQEDALGEEDVFAVTNVAEDPQTEIKAELNDSSSTQTPACRSSSSSADFCVRKPSSSRGSGLTRRLSEDLFTAPKKTGRPQSAPNHTGGEYTESQSSPVKPMPTSPLETSQAKKTAQQEAPATFKRFGLFHRLKGDQHPKKTKEKAEPKIQVPKILIQDFSDGTGVGTLVEDEREEKLSSRERRRRRRERERKEKEEEKVRKKREKEMEKERRKPQTRGKSFQTQKEKGSNEAHQRVKTGAMTLKYSVSASDGESYF